MSTAVGVGAMLILGMFLRWGAYLCVFVIVGAVVLRRVALMGLPVDVGGWRCRVEAELAGYGALAALALIVLDVGRLWNQTYAFFGPEERVTSELAMIIVNGTTWGTGWKAQIVAAAAAGLGLLVARGSRSIGWLLAMSGAMLVGASRPLTGHALEHGSWLSAAVFLQIVHVLTAAVWLGTLLTLWLFVLRRFDRLPQHLVSSIAATMVDRFSPVALGAAGALVAAGAMTSYLYLGALSSLVTTGYGRVLLLKLSVVAGIVVFGHYNWRRVRPRLRQVMDDSAASILSKSVRYELGLAVLALWVTALLVALPMPSG